MNACYNSQRKSGGKREVLVAVVTAARVDKTSALE